MVRNATVRTADGRMPKGLGGLRTSHAQCPRSFSQELPIGTLFAGSMRKSPNATSEIVQRRLAASPLAGRVRLFLLPDPVIRPYEPTGTIADLDGNARC